MARVPAEWVDKKIKVKLSITPYDAGRAGEGAVKERERRKNGRTPSNRGKKRCRTFPVPGDGAMSSMALMEVLEALLSPVK